MLHVLSLFSKLVLQRCIRDKIFALKKRTSVCIQNALPFSTPQWGLPTVTKIRCSLYVILPIYHFDYIFPFETSILLALPIICARDLCIR
jgi:hypothetical protein